ncbi:MAG TPA: MGMT family protein [Pseudomonadales bacterium]
MRNDIYQIITLIPEGRVATYGQIARMVDGSCHARQVGYALAATADNKSNKNEKQIPWHRVVNAKGEISARAESDNEVYQKILLESEGIKFDHNNRISLTHYQCDDSVLNTARKKY